MADIIDLNTCNYAESGAADFAFMAANGTKLLVIGMGGQLSASIDKNLNDNPIHVVFWLAYPDFVPGAACPAWNGQRTPFGDGQHGFFPEAQGFFIDSANPIEAVQEYTRWAGLQIVNGQPAWNGICVIDFKFDKLHKMTRKADVNRFTAGTDGYLKIWSAYADRGATLTLRPSLNERIEVWQETTAPYTDANGGPIDVAEMIVKFNRFPE